MAISETISINFTTGNTNGIKSILSSLNTVEQKATSGAGMLKFGAIAGAAGALASKAINGLSGEVGSAVKRFDTLNNASRAFANMGFSKSDVNKTISQLNDSIKGLPTSLDTAISATETLSGAFGNVQEGGKVFSAINDAVLGFGGSSDQASTAVTQLSQAFSNGKIDAQTWLSLMNAGMGPALVGLAKKMHMTMGQFKTALGKGKISSEQFAQALIDMDKNGGGGMQSLAKIAHDASAGIGSSFTNAKTAVVRGLTDILTAINSAVPGTNLIADVIQNFGSIAENALKAVGVGLGQMIQGFTGVGALDTPLGALGGSFANLANAVSSAITNLLIDIGLFKEGASGLTLNFDGADTAADIINGIANAINNLATFINQNQSAVEIFVATLLGLKALGAVEGIIGGLASSFSLIKTALAPITVILNLVGQGFSILMTMLGSFGSMLGSLVSGIFSVGSGLTGWIAGILGVDAGFASFLAIIGGVVAIGAIVLALVGGMATGWNGLGTIMSTIGSTIAQVFNSIVTAMQPVMAAMGPFIAALVMIGTTIWNAVAPAISSIISILGNVMDIVIQVLGVVISVAMNIITAIAPVIAFIISVVGIVINVILSIINSATTLLAGITRVVAFLINVVSLGWSTIFSVTTSIFSSIFSTIGRIFNNIFSAVSRVVNNVKDSVTGGWRGLVGTVSGIFNSIKNAITQPFTSAYDTVTGIIGKIKSTIGGIGSKIGKLLGFKLIADVDYSFPTPISQGSAPQLSTADSLYNSLIPQTATPRLIQGNATQVAQPVVQNAQPQPTTFILSLGGNQFKAFVSDITKQQKITLTRG